MFMWSPQAILLLFLRAAAAAVALTAGGAGGGGFPAKLTLERALPRQGVPLEHLIARDRARHLRHGRLLLDPTASTASNGVGDFPVYGTSDPTLVGLYYTRVKLGNPPKEFYVQIDTGSDVLWVTCTPCSGCPTSSGLNIKLEFFDPDSSSTSSKIMCADNRCTSALQTGEALCSSSDSSSALCDYSFQYGDGSATSGYYVYDTLYFDTIMGNGQHMNSSANIVFGCSNSVSGDLTKSDRAVDGIFGFGQQELSVISQLSSLGVAPKAFSHCLRGSDNGGGILVLGEVLEPGIVYTPLVQSQPHYNLNLESIAVNGQTLSIDSSLFTTSNSQGTIVDSGTTLAYLAEEAYNPFINAILSFASSSSSVSSVDANGNQCFVTYSSLDESFPSVSLNFMGGVSMLVYPEDYLIAQGYLNNNIIWCIGWQPNNGSGITILGDVVLKDKIFVYDLANQRVGWKDYDCSQSVNVSTSTGHNQSVNAGQLDVSRSADAAFMKKQLYTVVLMYLLILAAFWQ